MDHYQLFLCLTNVDRHWPLSSIISYSTNSGYLPTYLPFLFTMMICHWPCVLRNRASSNRLIWSPWTLVDPTATRGERIREDGEWFTQWSSVQWLANRGHPWSLIIINHSRPRMEEDQELGRCQHFHQMGGQNSMNTQHQLRKLH